jgi:hypothetical protein
VSDTANRGYEKLTVDAVRSRADAHAFIELPHRLYHAVPQWVPWFRVDMRRLMARKHPFFDHSEGEFYLARRADRAVARAAVLHNTRFNEHKGCRAAHFFFFDAEDDDEAVNRLFDVMGEWARARGLDTLIGPYGMGGTTGTGILIEGYEHMAAMTMMPWNPPYYERLLQGMGFTPYLDLYSARIDSKAFRLPDRVRALADKVIERGRFRVLRFSRKAELKRLALRIGEVYNVALASDPEHREAYPMSDGELERATADLMSVADPALIKVVSYGNEIVGFVFGFPDVSETMKRNDGRLDPLSILRLVRALRSTRKLIVNGAGILPRYQRLGANALLYAAIQETASTRDFRVVDLVQVAENTSLMLRDIKTLGGEIWKVHRAYTRPL